LDSSATIACLISSTGTAYAPAYRATQSGNSDGFAHLTRARRLGDVRWSISRRRNSQSAPRPVRLL